MTPEQWETIKELFDAVLQHSPDTRESFLAKADCSQEVRVEVQRLLANQSRLGMFLDTLVLNRGVPALGDDGTLLCTAGEVLAGRFKIIQFLGRGGMGELYEAEDLELQERVAIKTIRPDVLSSYQDSIKRFKREVHLARQVTHPNVCRIFDLFHHRGPLAKSVGRQPEEFIFISMELLRGETLAQRLKRAGKMNPAEALPIVCQVAAALQAAHDCQILHRDLKPGNVFLVPQHTAQKMRIVVTDFGLALDLGGKSSGSLGTSARSFVGTPDYMSPEQMDCLPLTPASDIYAFGLMMYQMVTGALPFADETPVLRGVRTLTETPPSPRIRTPDLEKVWETVILKCLQVDPHLRFQRAEDIVTALKGGSSQRVRPGRARRRLDSLAILPFTNVSGNPEIEYLSEGISESIINMLSRLPKLKVMAGSSVRRFKDRIADPQEVGRQLRVSCILAGQVVQRGNVLTVSAELVDVNEGWRLWGGHYNRQLEDIFAIQEDIAREISSCLQLKLSGEDRQHLSKRHTQNPEAYQLYLRGRYYWNKRTPEALQSGLHYFNLAIEKDPSYALAYAGVADSYSLLVWNLMLSPRDGLVKARAAAEQALTIDPSLSEGHASLGFVKLFYEWDWPGAEREFQEALRLNSKNAFAGQWYAIELVALGRFAESLDQSEKALDLEPVSMSINTTSALGRYFAQQYQTAREGCLKILGLEPDFFPAHFVCGCACEQLGEYSSAISELQIAVERSGGAPLFLAALAHAYAVAGSPGKSRSLLDDVMSRADRHYLSPYCVAVVYAGLGETDPTLLWLERARNERDAWMIFLRVHPFFFSLHREDRFQALLRELSLADRGKVQADCPESEASKSALLDSPGDLTRP